MPTYALSPSLPNPLALTELTSLDYTDANLVTVLKSIAYSYNLNLVISNNISGKVSARLKDITLDEALDALLRMNNYAFSREGNIVYIMPKSELTQISESIPLSYLLASEAKQILSKAISDKGDIQVNEATNSLVIKDYPKDLEKVKQLIKNIDKPPIQVLIEARIVDIKTTDVAKIGTAINAVYSPTTGKISSVSLNTGLLAKDVDGGQLKFAPRFSNLSADLTIDALVKEDRAKILASPSITTLNGQEARIIIGDRFPYKAATSVTGSTSTTSTEFVDVGTTLRVTPTVSPDGWITMKVHPEVSSVVTVTDAGPQITTREADAVVRVKDNDTIIIGGLISKNDDKTKDGVPGLRSIPVLGRLFQRQTSDQRKSELIVFITPHIIQSPGMAPLDKETAPEVYVDPKSFGKDVDLLSGLLSYAQTLERDIAKNPMESMYLDAELIKTYRTILQQFPRSGRSDYCLYKISEIYVKKFGKCEPAQSALIEMEVLFPESEYLEATKSFVNACLATTAYKDLQMLETKWIER